MIIIFITLVVTIHWDIFDSAIKESDMTPAVIGLLLLYLGFALTLYFMYENYKDEDDV
jgi:hypothetical protein